MGDSLTAGPYQKHTEKAMIGDEPPWLVNLIITISLLPILVGSLAEHVGTETLLSTLLLVFVLVGLYSVFGGQLVNPPRPERTGEGPVLKQKRSNPFAVHASETKETTEASRENDEPENDDTEASRERDDPENDATEASRERDDPEDDATEKRGDDHQA